MSPDELPSDVLELLRDHIPGLVELEVLLCVRSKAPMGSTVAAVAQHVGLPEAWIAEAMTALRPANLLAEDRSGPEPQFFYRPPSASVEAAVATLAGAYEERPAAIAKLLTESSISRVRRSASRAFLAAFVLRNEA